ncbi:hypothetical protein MMU07_12535 [Aquiflexum sp. LQ15W]|uniref:hypothetical protein n=1 Tax=Cognataquiflexum nitidum TaxID=2922272 RepID=UPI001F12F457|nr:hypothetical protein [Cognataquiflexum nitidum]MCH6200409.1 hypothetical protein [Cognataquiflexum nitidum]
MKENRERIDLSKFRGHRSSLFTGRPQGVNARVELNLNNKDLDLNLYTIFIPKGTTSINPSFFLGLFYESIKKLGFESFENKYKFEFGDNSDRVLNVLKSHIQEGLDYAKNSLKDINTLKKIFS